MPDTDGVYLVPAFVGLGAPYWDPRARGVIIGLTRNTTIGHIARAAVDAMAYQTRDVLEADAAGGGLQLDDAEGGRRRGGERHAAAVPGRPARRRRCGGRWWRETTALGAAYLAGLAVGYWDGLDDVRAELGARSRVRAVDADERRASGCMRAGRRPSARSLNWED